MKANLWTAGLALAGVGALATGCVERQVEYVPVYRVQPAYAGQPAYPPPAQPPPNSGAGAAPAAPTADWQQPPPAPGAVQAQATVVAPSAPPAPQVEVVPVSPGPYYVWAPGYWGWNGGWVWIGGQWIVRPRPGAIWVGGHWGRRGHGYVWIGGRWR